MIKKILVAYDAGKLSQKALETAMEIARSEKSEIFVITSIKIPDYILLNMSFGTDIGVLDNVDNLVHENYQRKLEEAAETVKKEGIPVQTVYFKDKPGEAVVSFAEKEGVDLIVIGSKNYQGLDKALLGSVSSYVAQNAQCAVMIIKA